MLTDKKVPLFADRDRLRRKAVHADSRVRAGFSTSDALHERPDASHLEPKEVTRGESSKVSLLLKMSAAFCFCRAVFFFFESEDQRHAKRVFSVEKDDGKAKSRELQDVHLVAAQQERKEN